LFLSRVLKIIILFYREWQLIQYGFVDANSLIVFPIPLMGIYRAYL
jgi:hypothetical protein